MIVRVNVVLNSHCQQQFYSGLRSLHPDDHAPPTQEKTCAYHVAKKMFANCAHFRMREGDGEGIIIMITVGLGIYISKMKLRKRLFLNSP